jgi:diadenosine tetraphosphate (Ap4A) HIT family hydrolase
MSEECVFCAIGEGRLDALVVGENPRALAFLDRHPISDGHMLVIPKHHSENFLDMPAEDRTAVADLAHDVAYNLSHTLPRFEGFNLLMSNGQAAGQSVFHTHLHVFPRVAGDGYDLELKPERVPSLEELRAVQALLLAGVPARNDD